MSIVHLAFFKWKQSLSDQQIEALRQGFAALQSIIPEIKNFRWIHNNSSEGLEKGFREGLCMEFDDLQSRQQYLEHPAHVSFARDDVMPALESGLDSVLVFDYEK